MFYKLWCWRRLLRVLCTARTSNQFILKEISPEYSLEGLMLKLKLQYFGHLMRRTDSSEKTLMLGKIEGERRRGWQKMRREKKGMTEDEMVGWHHWLDGREFEWTLGVGDGQGGLACCSPWDHKELDTTERLNWMFKDFKNHLTLYSHHHFFFVQFYFFLIYFLLFQLCSVFIAVQAFL